ncbi:MAG: serine hydrolase domain-containing protein [Acidobacteriota bacterium]
MSRLRTSAVSLLLSLTLAGVLSAPADGAKLGSATAQKLDRALGQALRQTKAPGAIAGVWIGDRGWKATRGSTVRGGKRRPGLDTHTRIASVTKTFTGTLILQLVDRGRLRLDDTIDRWFPTLKGAAETTVRDLGDMGSGIMSYSANRTFVDRYLARPKTVWKPSELITAGVRKKRLFDPGDGFNYSNTNFVMLGRIIQKVTGNHIARVMKRRIFGPLKMSETSYPFTTGLPRPFWNGYTEQAVSGNPLRNATRWSPTFAGAAGQIVSTLADMRRYTRALGMGSLLSPATQRERLKPNPASIQGGREYLFALGRENGWLAHTGTIPGYNSEVAYLPDQKISIVVFANSDTPDADRVGPAPAILDALADVVSPGQTPGGSP